MIDMSSRIILAITGVAVLTIAWLWWPDLSFGIGAENAPLGWLQSNWLIACATTAGIRATQSSDRAGSPHFYRGWAVLSAAIFVAALDERFMFHEQLQDALANFLMEGDIGAALDHTERWTQGLTACYALAGLGSAAWLYRSAAPGAWRWMRAAILVGIVAIGMDLSSDAMGPQIIEEMLEFAAESLMLCGLVKEVRSVVNR